jgi:RHS repeat-associated protein
MCRETQGGQPAGTVVWRWKLNQQTATGSNAFGAQPAEEDPDGNGTSLRFDLRFPGQHYDAATGLHYNYFRDYEPGTGRYVESDPIGLVGGVNTYAYGGDNPLLNSDPTGEAFFVWRSCKPSEVTACKKYCSEVIGRPYESCSARVGFRLNIDKLDVYNLPGGLSCSCKDEESKCDDKCVKAAVWIFIEGVGMVLLTVCTLGLATS